LDQS